MSVSLADSDRRFMRKALALARRGRDSTKPNPMVGAIVVKNGKLLARGFHRRAGLPHAEVEVLAKLGKQAADATLYVTLEPCCHHGRTGPCTDAIVQAGIRRVVVGCCDENPLVSGRGIAHLRRAGIRVDAGCLKEECRALNRAFFTWIRGHRPWVTLKVASTLDGRIGDRMEKFRRGEHRWITGLPARKAAHQLRAEHDAVLVGRETIRADNPRLTIRLRGQASRQPLRVVLDSQLRTPPGAAILDDKARTLLVAVETAQQEPGFAIRKRRLEAAGAEVLLVPADRAGRVSLPATLQRLAEREVQSLLVEGGGRIHSSFIREGLVDSFALFLAPRLVGDGVPIADGSGLDWRAPALLGPLTVRKLGADLLVTADVIDRGRRRRIPHAPNSRRPSSCSPVSSKA